MSKATDQQEAVLAPSPIPNELLDPTAKSQLETDPEVSAKRTAQMQQMTERSMGAGAWERVMGKLTIIWDHEKKEIMEHLEALEKGQQQLEASLARLVTPPREKPMESYQERVISEQKELEEKLLKLDLFLATDTSKALPERDKLLLHRQRGVMQEYSDILHERRMLFLHERKVHPSPLAGTDLSPASREGTNPNVSLKPS